jgi:hypothetical protein
MLPVAKPAVGRPGLKPPYSMKPHPEPPLPFWGEIRKKKKEMREEEGEEGGRAPPSS